MKESTFNSRSLCCFRAFSFLTKEKSTKGNPSHWQRLLCVLVHAIVQVWTTLWYPSLASERYPGDECSHPPNKKWQNRLCFPPSSFFRPYLVLFGNSGFCQSYWWSALTGSDGKQTAKSGGGHSQRKKIFLSEWMRKQNKSEVSSFALFAVKNYVVSYEWINIVVEYNCNYNCIYVLHS